MVSVKLPEENKSSYYEYQKEPITNPDLINLLEEFNDIFRDELPYGTIHRNIDVEHRIPLKEGARPVQVKQYRLSPRDLEQIKLEVEKLIKNGHIRESKSPFRSPLLVVVKKDGKFRVCVDMRWVNNITEDNMYPIPMPDTLMMMMQGSRYFTLMDLLSGYHQIPIAEEDKHKKAFSVPNGGHYEFEVMPFGLKGAPATFQNAMDIIFREYIGKFIAVYIDDIAIWSKSPTEHLERLRNVFELMRKHKLYARKDKCYFMQTRIPYLGFFLSENGIEADPRKVQAIQEWQQPRTVQQVRSFLGVTGFYRIFIQGYANIARPLTELTKNDTPFEWTETCTEAFQKLKDCLTTAPVLKLPDFSKTFTVTCDASNIAIGAVVSQDQHPIAFFSQKLKGAELNYPTHDKELLAIKRALEQWRHILQGQRKFNIFTDNSAITFMNSTAQLKGRQARWAEFFSDFNFNISHKPGKENVVADGLSRKFNLISEIDPSNWLEKVKELSKKLPTEGLEIRDGLLYKNDRIFIPRYRDVIRIILQEKHDNPLGGHFGIAKTVEAVKRTYYWDKIRKDVEDYIQSCDFCQRYKANKQKPFGLLQPIPPPKERFHTYSMDFIGPLLKTKDGYDGMLTIVEMLTKFTILEPIKMTFGAPEIAKNLLQSGNHQVWHPTKDNQR